MVGGIEISPPKTKLMFFRMLKYDTRLLNNDGNNKGVFMCANNYFIFQTLGALGQNNSKPPPKQK
jgi:hypothetical protein